jgi:hypothetical protein
VTFPKLLARQRRPEIGIALTHQPESEVILSLGHCPLGQGVSL